MIQAFIDLFNFEKQASENQNRQEPVVRFIGLTLITASFTFSALHFLYQDWIGVQFLITSGLIAIALLWLTPKLGLTLAGHLYATAMAVTITYFHISLDSALTAWFPVIAVFALLANGWRAGLLWLSMALLILTTLFLFPVDKTQVWPTTWAVVPETYQHLDHFLIAIGATLLLTLLMMYVEVGRSFAFRRLAEHRDNLEQEIESQVNQRIAEKDSYEREIEATQKELIMTMSTVLENRSNETGNHVQRVCEFSSLLAKKAGLSQQEQELIFIAASMHDVGKVAIPDRILTKPGKLTEAEFTEMKHHTLVGYDMLKGSKKPIIQTAAVIALYHHEWWNGQGYPHQLEKEDIPIYARIVAIADVYDALISERVYKAAWSQNKVLRYFEERQGTQFDPQLTQLLLDNAEDFALISQNLKD